MSDKKPLLKSALLPVLAFVVMVVAYAAVYHLSKEQSLKDYAETIAKVPSIRLFGSGMAERIRSYVPYGGALGLVFGLLNLLAAYILFGLFALARLNRRSFGATLALLFASIPFVFLGWSLAFSSTANTALAAGIVYFVGRPLWYASIATAGFSALLFILSFKYGQTKEQV